MIRLALVAIAVLVTDQVTKALIRGWLVPNASIAVIPHVLSWTYIQNTHGAFGLFGSHPLLLAALALPILGFFLVAYRHVLVNSVAAQVALGAILGGALGNMWDRIHAGYATDFVDVAVWNEKFNVADAAITLGAIALALVTIRRRRVAPPATP